MKKFSADIILFLVLLVLSSPGAAFTCPYQNGSVPVPTTSYPDGPYGSIFVETSPPGAIVYVNGMNYGRSPATITGLFKGNYAITVKMPGFEDYFTQTTISGPTRSSVYCPLIPDKSGNGLYVMSTPPRANVYVDEVLRGETPLMLGNASPGSHHVVVNLSGYDDWETTVVVPATGTRVVAAVLDENDDKITRGINITTKPPGAKVRLDSAEKGVTPLTLKNIAEGIHIVELEYPGYKPWKSTVNVPATGLKEVSVNLTPEPSHAPGWITISSIPGNASVTLDGEYAGKTPVNSTLNLDEISPGEHTVVVVLSGYRSHVIRTTVVPNQVSALNATLEPVSGPSATGSLYVMSEPPGAMVFVDNQSVGTTPFTADIIATGNHEITLRLDGYEDFSLSVLVGAGTQRNVTATLLPVTRSLHTSLPPAIVIMALCILGICFRRLRR
ncbi:MULTISPECIES: PEGA domain-containing protein [unclassified Methanoregula]|uniref:PEGA domain-containing protein n=1 Tax=unclassified Methanoregula TaxID=2649730 RepID=UPI0009D09C4B|nr:MULTISPECIES: PEGA domain-containing protein [unclassified Methanoregula]OPX65059.1 MAG: PEGA domain protein [Methanoregula sp. PtaB.Bin085]OPY32338.1 MAG: PEGA domain protein [Methanoregula sp. PtaU1.Bin006]